jgi:hypothetical protein
MLPRAVMIRAKVLGVVLALGLLLGAALLPGCFSSCRGKPAAPAAPAAPAVQTPPSPVSAPVIQTPTSPPPGPDVQTPEGPPPTPEPEVKKEEPPKPILTLEGMRAVREGMTQAEVQGIIGAPGALIAGTDEASTVYRWNQAGLSFLAKFENGKLVRKSIITPQGEEISAEKDESKTIDKDLYDGIHPGMSFEEVMDRIGIEAQPISRDGATVAIYTWRDANGSSFTARFEDGKLVKKSGLFAAKGRDKAREGAKAEGETEGETAEGENAPAASANEEKTAEKAEEKNSAVENAGQPADDETGGSAAEPTPPEPRKGRVTVSGSSRREREAEKGDGKSDRSYRPRAQLPQNLHRLRNGSYEIRIHNTAGSRVKAAVVSQEGSADVTIPPGGKQSVFVNQGDYVVHFIYEDDPYTLHQGGVIPIGQWLTDMEVFLLGGSYNVQVLDRSTDRPASRGKSPSLKDEFRR